MSVKVGAAISREPDSLAAGAAAGRSVAETLDGASADLVLVFASGAHLSNPEQVLVPLHTVLAPGVLVGCAAGGVLGSRREVEDGTAQAVWEESIDEAGEARPFHAAAEESSLGPDLDGMPALSGASGAILLADPYSFPAEMALGEVAETAAGVPVLGGLVSAEGSEGSLFVGEEIYDEGAVGVSLHGVEVLPCVSQGAAPVGRELTITAAEDNIIRELAGRPALQTVERIVADLPRRERGLVAGGLLIGIVIDSGKPEFEQGDFLVRAILGADPESGSLAVGAAVREGQVVRLHARDSRSAHEDMQRALRLQIEAMSGARPAGSLLFSCNGRGQAMFGASNHDAEMVHHELRGSPAAGFFAAGEIGPVGGRSFLHGFTATLAVFPA